MATKSLSNFQPRKTNVLATLDMLPLTTAQLLMLSETFDQPFTNESTLRHYLSTLRKRDGLIQSFPYAIETDGRPPVYWKLTRSGYRQLYGHRALLPKRRYFERIGPVRHEHTRAIGDFMVKTLVTAHRAGLTLVQIARENSVRLDTPAGQALFPDACFSLRDSSGCLHNFVLELDNGSERIQSTRDIESIGRKIDGYDAHQTQFESRDPNRYFVLFVTTRSDLRVQHMLAAARERMQNPQRAVFLLTDLTTYLDTENPILSDCFIDNAHRRRPLVKSRQSPGRRTFSPSFITGSFAMC